MPIRKEVRDVSYSTGYNASPSTAIPPTGGAPFLSGPTLEPDLMTVMDATGYTTSSYPFTGGTPAILGKLLVATYVAGNTADAFFIQCATAGIQLAETQVGVVIKPAVDGNINQEATIAINGPCNALIKTGGTAAVVGSPLTSDALGNMAVGVLASVLPGALRGFVLAAQGANTGPTMRPVVLGSF